MNTNLKKTVLTGAVVLTGVTTFAGWNLSLSEGWRLTGGAEFGGPVNATVRSRVCPQGSVPVIPPGGLTRAQAQAIVKGQLDTILAGKRVDFGAGAYIDPKSGALSQTFPNYTRNWRLPRQSSIASSVSYREVNVTESASGFAASEDDTSVGASVELSKTLWESDDLPIGVDFAFAFAWLRRNNLVNSEMVTYSRDTSETSGSVNFDLGDQPWIHESGLPHPGGMYGNGSPTGPGPIMDLSLFNMGSSGGGDPVTSHYVERVAVRGDWEEWDFRLTIKPWWDVADWLRVYGTFGVEIAKTCFEMDVTTYGTERHHRSRSIDDWQVNGIAGLGAALRWQHMTLGFDFLARFLQQDITIDDSEVKGTIDRQRWLARIYLGVDF